MYVIVVLTIEVWFQIEAWQNLSTAGRDVTILLSVILLIQSHLLWIIVFILDLMGPDISKKPTSFENYEDYTFGAQQQTMFEHFVGHE